ncbi:MAG: hypothetical protein GWO85_01365 [Simkaniaceae bacterium]|nr:hypothetical protein [Simkaniaceae bacterium]
MKQTGMYFIIGGAIILVFVFVKNIFTFLASHPITGLAIAAVIIGAFLMLYSVYQESQADKDDEPFRDIES